MKALINALLVAGIASFLVVAPSHAQGTLDEIIKRGRIIVGVSLSTPPYGILNEKMEPDGFDVDIAKVVARDLGVKVELVDTASQSRIPYLTSGKVDVVISSFGILAERAKAVMFSNSIYVDEQLVIAPKTIKMESYQDLVGKKIGVTRGTTNDILLTQNALPGTQILRYEDAATGNQALFSGQVDGIVSGRAAAFAITKETDKFEPKFPMRRSPMSIGVRRGDFDLLQWVNTEVMLLWYSGELQALQQKWIGSANSEVPRF
jgi:polar amino acid transport system substrate-binding protein